LGVHVARLASHALLTGQRRASRGVPRRCDLEESAEWPIGRAWRGHPPFISPPAKVMVAAPATPEASSVPRGQHARVLGGALAIAGATVRAERCRAGGQPA
jgi:hypothetical protein